MKYIMKKSQFVLSVSLNFKTINLTLEYHEVHSLTVLVDPLESHIQSLCNFRQISVQCKNSQGEKRNQKKNVSSHHVRTQCVLILEKLKTNTIL